MVKQSRPTLEVGQLMLKRTHHLSSAANAFTGKIAPKYKGSLENVGKKDVNVFFLQDKRPKL